MHGDLRIPAHLVSAKLRDVYSQLVVPLTGISRDWVVSSELAFDSTVTSALSLVADSSHDLIWSDVDGMDPVKPRV
jgi:hypothetical protein